MRIVAPFDGVVTRRLVNRGVLAQAATATAGAPLLTVQRTDLMRVLVDVPEADAAKVGPGTPTEVVPYGLGPGLAAGYGGGMIGRQGREDRRRGEGNIQRNTSPVWSGFYG
jgi:multidrug resistance efflux pump